jgi:glutathione-specific gamma-glutamylcyclotransferase
MWDGWHTAYGCSRSAVGVLDGFRRAFDKPSVRNWGTKAVPGPTLNLVRDHEACCRGIAFEFPESRREAVVAYLDGREGKSFPLREHAINVEGAGSVVALIPLYEGKNVIACLSVDQTADMVARAVGRDGRCIDYVTSIAAKLQELGIEDVAVAELLSALGRNVSQPST